MDDFYEQLTPFYHLIYHNWATTIPTHGNMLHNIIRSEWGARPSTILDVSCGATATQSIALATLGYDVTASDLSPAAVARAQQEAAARGLEIDFSVADMRAAYAHHGGGFDVVISAGNSIPHLLSDEEIVQALRAFYACLRPGGGCVLTTRQYDHEERGEGLLKPFGVRDEGDRRYIIFQVWDFEGEKYDFAMYFLEEDRASGELQAHVMRSRYYAISPDHLATLLTESGFGTVKRLDDGVTHPAILVGTRPGGQD